MFLRPEIRSKVWRRAAGVGRLFAVIAPLAACSLVVPQPDVVVGTGSPSGTYFPLGGSICRLFNLDMRHDGRRCAVIPSIGPISNVDMLRNGSIDVGIVHSDVLADAVAGEGSFASRERAPELRVLFAGHSDAFTIVARRELGIRGVAELRGKRINLGRLGSGERVSAERIMTALGATRADFAGVHELTLAAQRDALCNDELDAIVYEVAHPNGLIQDVVRRCGGVLVDVKGPAIDAMLRQHPEYVRAEIPGGTYLGNPRDVQTIGVRTVVVTTARLSDDLAYEIAKGVFQNFEDFRRLHPAFSMLSIGDMVDAAGRAPLHPGAERYYRERGWLR